MERSLNVARVMVGLRVAEISKNVIRVACCTVHKVITFPKSTRDRSRLAT